MELEVYRNDTELRVVFNLKNPTRDYSHGKYSANIWHTSSIVDGHMVTVFGVCVCV